ncbi:hypothetical protein BU23DRAFT_259347 [Bimuria novae-zelandiae CBS 107.79]|uniref:Zn(2)-C6 fungal-type domain-containing protein n=1 Tax=Bimuria novae-zelandiae CBS 107.79 TaxID=1447943 RepID=A0A6A5UXQ6_9PLEO|nr:hypothetical protein BU23DRAFT_259347 [Bimuria novae-zelandiae CBS 107.79]
MAAIDAAGAPLRSAPPPARQAAAPPSYPHTSPIMQTSISPSTVQAATSPSTAQASPLSPHLASLPNGSTARVRGSDAPKPRARLACQSCRTSKIRCNPRECPNFTDFPCEHCRKSGKECVWPLAGSTSTAVPKRSSASAGGDSPQVDRQAEPRKRKRVVPSEMKIETEEDFYSPQLFTEQVWRELYSIFKQHYITELPFLHEATFLPMLKQTDIHCLPPDSSAPLILALVSLTVPYHAGLIQQLSQGGRLSAIQISRIYADAAEHRIHETRAHNHPDTRLVQALLMLSLRAHGDGQGIKSSVTLAIAISFMQLLGCHYEKDLDDKADKIKQSAAKLKLDPATTTVDGGFIDDEIKRRTFWSCYIIDRYISSGDYKPRKIHIKEALVQLPCSNEAFLYGISKIKTRMLRETEEHFGNRRREYARSHPDEEYVEWEDEDKQEPLVWFIKALDLYEDVMKWACNVTRRNEKDPPWTKTFVDKYDRFGGTIKKELRLSFANLDERLTTFVERLPAKLKLTTNRTLAHIHGPTSTPFILLHSVLALCNIVLHREWLPFLPNPESGPDGPVDGPNCVQFKERAHEEAPRFWEESAARCFKATKQVLDLMWLSKEHGASVESPFTSFVSFTVVCTLLWCGFFPFMDTKHFVCSGKDQPDVIQNFDKVASLLHSMQNQLNLARAWCKIAKDYVPVLIEARQHWKNTVGSPSSGYNNDGRGLRLYKPYEMKLKSFGPQPDDRSTDVESMMNLTDILRALDDSLKHTDDGMRSDVKSEMKSEDSMTVDGSTDSGSIALRRSASSSTFTAVNNSNGETHGSSHSKMSYVQSPQAHSVHKSLPVPTHGLPSHQMIISAADPRQHFVSVTPINYGAPAGQEGATRPMGDVGNHPPNNSYPAPEMIVAYNNMYQGLGLTWDTVHVNSVQTFVGNEPNFPFYQEQDYSMHQPFYGNHGNQGL